MNILTIAVRIASRRAWIPPETDSGDTLTLIEYAGPIGPADEIIEQDGHEYVIRKPSQEESDKSQES